MRETLSRVGLVVAPFAIILLVVGVVLPLNCLGVMVGFLGLIVSAAMVTSLSASLMARPWARDFFTLLFGEEIVGQVLPRQNNDLWLIIPVITILLSSLFSSLLSLRIVARPSPSPPTAIQPVVHHRPTDISPTSITTRTPTTFPSWTPAIPAETPTPSTSNTAQPLHPTLTPLATCTPAQTATLPPVPRIAIAEVHGRNSGNSSLDQEYVILLNFGPDIDMEGWTVSDGEGHKYIFPDFRLPNSAAVKLYTGRGYNSEGELFWGRNSAVWDAGADTVYLTDDRGVLIDQYSY